MKLTKEELNSMIKDNNNYILGGLLYYNKRDPRILPPKRLKWMGWTINFANKKSIFLLVIVIFAIITIGSFFQT